MQKKYTYIYISACLSFLVPVPGRFVYGFVLSFELMFLMLIGTSLTSLIRKFKFEKVASFIYLFAFTAFVVFYRQIFILTQTEIAMTLGYAFYLPSVSSFLIGYVLKNEDLNLVERLSENMIKTSLFCVFSLMFFLFRDICGYGTFTFFGKNHMIYEKVIFDSERISAFSFFASIPGALLLCSIILTFHIFMSHKFEILRLNESKGRD